MTTHVPEEEFDAVTREGFWIADYYTGHCGPCKMLDLVRNENISGVMYGEQTIGGKWEGITSPTFHRV